MSVIILTTEMRTGGTCRDATEWANRLVAAGEQVLLVAQSADESALRKLSFAVRFERLGVSRAIFAARPLLRLLRARPSAVVLANSGALAGLVLVLRGLGLVRNRVVFVDPFNPADTFRRSFKTAIIYRRLLWRSDAFVHLSKAAEKIHIGLGLQHEKSHVIPNISSRAAPASGVIPVSGALRVIAIGRLDKIKGFDRLIAAFSQISARWPRSTLRIVGEGYDRARLEELIVSTGQRDSIVLAGHTDAVDEELRQAHLFVLPSRYEGMPNTLVEALDAGLRVVATPCRGPVGSLMRELGIAEMIISETAFAEDLPRAIEAALALDNTGWCAVRSRFLYRFDNERNFRALHQLLKE
jgi:glycosyltransferase involved in cell wall biosynthesis